MIERALLFIKEHGSIIDEQVNYLLESDWTSKEERRNRISEFELHKKIITGLLSKAVFVFDEAGEELKNSAKARDFIQNILNAINNYIEICNRYFNQEKWTEYEGDKAEYEKAYEIDFQDDILKVIINLKERIKPLLPEQQKEDVVLSIYGGAVLSYPFRSMMKSRYPEIEEITEKRMS